MTEQEINDRIEEIIAACLAAVNSLTLLDYMANRARKAYNTRLI